MSETASKENFVINNGRLFASLEALQALAKCELPVTTAYQVAKTLRRAEGSLDAYVVTRQELVKKYTKRDADGNDVPGKEPGTVEVDPTFHVDLRELDAINVSLDVSQIKIGDLGGNKMSAGHMMALDWLIVD